MNPIVVKRIRKRMVDLDISGYAELARRLGINQGYLCHILKGRKRGEGVKKRIAEMLDLSVRSLLAA